MRQDLTTADIKDLLLSVSNTNDVEIKNKVIEILKDCSHLNKVEKEIIQMYEILCNEVGGVPTVGTLVARDQTFTEAKYIQDTSLIEYAKIFTRNKQNIKMHDLIITSTSDYISGKINFDTFGSVVQEALVIGAPNKMEEDVESNLDDSFYEKLTEEKNIEKGVALGIPCIDEIYRGLLPGDVLTIAGYAGSMKTTLTANLAYNAATLGKNTLYLSLEVSKDDLTIALLSRHSMSNGKTAVTRSEMKEFAVEHKEEFMELAKDYSNLPGKIRIIDEKDIVTYSTTAFNDVIDRVNKELIERTQKGIDIIVLDHIQLLKFNDSKSAMDNPYQLINYYTSYFREKAAREGYAVVLVSQTSRTGYEYAVKHNGQYLETGLAEANELERASTGIITVFATETGKQSHEITVQLLKNRFGEKMPQPQQAPLFAEYFMVGNGVSLESEEVGPVFDLSGGSALTNQEEEQIITNLEEILSNG